MGPSTPRRGSPQTPIVFPGIPWLVDGNKYEPWLKSCLEHLHAQRCPEAEVLPPFLTKPINRDFARIEQMGLVNTKLNEIIEEFLKTKATHLWFLNADNEVPEDALFKLLELDVDVISGISPPHKHVSMSTAMRWMPPASPEYPWSMPYYKAYPMKEVLGKVIGGDRIIATGHFCLLCKRRVFERFSPKFEPLRFRWNPPQKLGNEIVFWQEAHELGFVCRIHGGVLCGHLPELPLETLRRQLRW